ncbi:hypothetical protein CNR22_11420 [Sphingobacteriaceae bacterium]|nr:hypothetical protein CNR22_11420 [Sphingobacteriaceae bacterium]
MKINYALFSLLCFLSVAFSSAQDTTRILFIGNSFTFYNNMPAMVKALADSAKIKVITGMHAPGGVSVGDTAQGTMAHMNNPALFSLIRSKKWDVAVIQDNQGRFVRDSAVFSGASKVVQGHLNIMDSLKANNNCAKIVLFGGWAWKNGSPPFGNTGIECIQRILVNYRVLNDTMKEIIAPIGEAWIKASKHLPSVNLWDFDDAHPSYAGSYLTASVIFSTIFDTLALPQNYIGTLNGTDASKLRAFGDSAVFGSAFHSKYNLGGIKRLDPIYHTNGYFKLAGNYTKYFWYKNNVYLANTPTVTIQGTGLYKVIAEESDGCLIKSCSYKITTTTVTTVGLPENANQINNLLVFPNPASEGFIVITSDEPIAHVDLFNLAGQLQKSEVEPFKTGLKISTRNLPPGCYFMQLSTKDKIERTKIVIE